MEKRGKKKKWKPVNHFFFVFVTLFVTFFFPLFFFHI